MRTLALSIILLTLPACNDALIDTIRPVAVPCDEVMYQCLISVDNKCPGQTDADRMTAKEESERACAHMLASRCYGTKLQRYQFVLNSIIFPNSSPNGLYAKDFDGDGRSENKLFEIVSVARLFGGNVPLDTRLFNGNLVNLLEIYAPGLDNPECVRASLTSVIIDSPGLSPNFDGKDRFTIKNRAKQWFVGKIANGQFQTLEPIEQTHISEVAAVVPLPTVFSRQNQAVTLRATMIYGTLDVSRPVPRIYDGQINGVVSRQDIDHSVVPNMARSITALIRESPASYDAKTIISSFENISNEVSKNKCLGDPTKCCSKNPQTCEIIPAEVSDSFLGSLLSPDVQVFDDRGRWHPVTGGKQANGMSVGFGFGAIGAGF